MNDDPSINLVVFELIQDGKPAKVRGSGNTRDNDCVSHIWQATQRAFGLQDQMVQRIYSEWQPSLSDVAFLAKHFPQAQVTYTFARPRDGQWEQAFDEARRQMQQAASTSPENASRKKATRTRFSFARLFPWLR